MFKVDIWEGEVKLLHQSSCDAMILFIFPFFCLKRADSLLKFMDASDKGQSCLTATHLKW